MRGQGSSKFLLVFGTIIFSCFFVAKFALAAVEHLVISQIQIEGPGGVNDEFVELYNPAGGEVDLTGWSVKKETAGGAGSSSNSDLVGSNAFTGKIQPRSYFLIAKLINYTGSVLPDLDYSSTSTNYRLAVNNTVLLYNMDNAVVDKVGFGAASDYEGATTTNPSSGKVLARRFVNGEVVDTDDNSADFVQDLANPHNSSSTSPALDFNIPETIFPLSSTASSTLPAKGIIVISEILPNPAGTDEGNEAVELINTSTSTISLDGWYLDGALDDSDGTKIYQISGQSILPGEFLTITIPTSYFKFYNTSSASSSDTAILYFPDKTVADSVAYPFPAPDDKGWQNVSGQWMWAPRTLGSPNAAPPPPVQNTSGGGGGGATIYAAAPANVKLNEIFPNPAGEDSGNEWIEIYNLANATTSLEGYFLDDGESDAWGSSAWPIPKGIQAPPSGFAAVTLPKGVFALNNSGKERVKLFSPQKQLLDSVWYEDAAEGKAWAKGEDGKWAYGLPTPGTKNIFDMPLAEVVISELLPNPLGDDEEFIELYNVGTTTPVNLEGFKLAIGEREKVLGNIILATSSRYVLFEEDLPVKLRNSGQTVSLFDSFGRQLSKVTYPKALAGQVYALLGDDYFWTDQLSPGEENPKILGASVQESPKPAVEKSASQTQDVNYAKLYKENKKLNEELGQKLSNLETMLAMLAEKGNSAVQQEEDIPYNALTAAQSQEAKGSQKYLYLAITLLSVVVFALLVKEIFQKKSFK